MSGLAHSIRPDDSRTGPNHACPGWPVRHTRPGPRRSGVCALVAMWTAAAFTGCGSPKFAPVSGRVTIDGQPAEGIIVYFSPQGSDPMHAGMPSRGRTSADGRFQLSAMDGGKDRRGALVGTHTVTMDDERTFERLNTKSRVPIGWQTSFEVPPAGTDKADFDVRTR